MPEGIRRDQFLSWIENLSDRQSPAWLGLPSNAEKVLLTNLGSSIITKLLKLQLLEDDDDIMYTAEAECSEYLKKKRDSSDGRPAWMRLILNSAVTWKRLLPKNLQLLRRTVENIKDPLY